MYTGLLHLHSSLRYVIVILLLITIAKSIQGWIGKKQYSKRDFKLALFTMIFLHVQLLIGLGLYFISPNVMFTEDTMSNPMLRFWAVEHIAGMIIGVVIITIGRANAKKSTYDHTKHKRIGISYILGFLVIFFSIPWPFLKEFGRWYVSK